ncbi:FG-GAP-like repeat-containing protein [Flavobacterium sp. JP2137]|uniref:FG-GAP-like repeat-containing protein n=1 Tax=Flavobacterium sp. JP2137 TaxID=3414510 RepID=UPI003D2FA4C0
MKKLNYAILLLIALLGWNHQVRAQQFTRASETELEGAFYGDCAAIALDNSGYPGLIISGALLGYQTGHTALYQNELGRYTPLEQLFTSIMYSSIATGDLNGDGFEDFAIMGTKNDGSSPVEAVFEIYYNNGDNTFVRKDNTGIAAANFGSLKIADLNGDGLPDLFVNGNSGSTYISKIYFQDAEGNFSESDNALTGTYFSASSLFDADGDGLVDILVTGFDTAYKPSATLYLNRGNGIFEAHDSGIAGVYFSSVDAKDFDGDGSIDVLVSGMNTAYAASLSLYLNDGNGNFTPSPHNFSGTYTGSSSLVDYNNDGHLDIFSMGTGAQGQNLTLFYKNDGSGDFVEDLASAAAVQALNMSKAQWLDYNIDGLPDLITMGYTGDRALTALYLNTNRENQAIESVAISTENDVEPEISTENGSLQLTAVVNPNNAVQTVIWTIESGSDLATINQSGRITATASGTVNARATSAVDASKYAELEVLIHSSAPTDPYCRVTVDYEVEPITLVRLADLENTSSPTINGSPAYEDFTALIAHVERGETYTLTVKGNTAGNFENDIRVFIDWNQDTVFDMHSEYYSVSLMPSSGTDFVEATISLSIPQNALEGQTRMRIVKDQWNIYEAGDFDACTDAYYGQIADYTLSITAAVAVENVFVTTANHQDPEITLPNGTLQLYAMISPQEVNQGVTWSVIQGQSLATVDQNGLVTAITNGTIRVRANSVKDPSKYDEIEITIQFTLGIRDFNTSALQYYPNPVTDVLHIDSDSEITRIQVFNMLGQRLLEKSTSDKQTHIDLSEIPAGTYSVRITSNSAQKTIKIIKN